MVVTASYGLENSAAILTTAEVTGSCTITPQPLVDGTTAVTITYGEGGITVTTTQVVTVTHKLESIAVTTNPTKVTYEYGDTLATTGMIVTATYSDNTTAAISGSCSPTVLNTVGTQTITVTYSENGISKTTTFSVTVNRKSVAKPTWKANKTYNGNVISVTDPSNWNNFNSSYMSIGGTTSSTNAGIYAATFTLGSNYRWTDGSTSSINVNWTINKATGSFTLSTSSVSINASNYSTGVTVTVSSATGTVTVSSNNSTACPASINGNIITIKGNGSTAGSFTVTVSCAASTNYTAPANKTISVSIAYWSWGSETAAGNAAWWAGLKSALAGMTATERANLVGKKKKVTLSTAVAGWSSGANVSVIAVAADTDADKSLTFQTEGCSPTSAAFSSSSTLWASSAAKSTVETFANNCSATASMLSVTKLTSSICNNNKNNAADVETTAKGFLPSEIEMGIGNNYSSSNLEGTKGRTVKAYSYYDSNNKRIKYQCSANGDITTNTGWYWERSRYYNTDYSNYVCFVNNTGGASHTNYNYTSGRLAPAFVIG